MFGMGVPELVVVLVIVLILFGPGRLPEFGKSLGKAIGAFKQGIKDGENDGPSKPSADAPK